MDCRQFRENHLAFVDDTLPGIELVGMQMHITECEDCARHDAIVRRSLMLFRNLPSIQPSPDFAVKLERKLADARLANAMAHSGRSRRLAATVVVTSAVMLGYIGISLRRVDSPGEIRLPPVVALASSPDPAPPEVDSPAPEMIAAASAGLPIWTVALLAEQTIHFASLESIAATR